LSVGRTRERKFKNLWGIMTSKLKNRRRDESDSVGEGKKADADEVFVTVMGGESLTLTTLHERSG